MKRLTTLALLWCAVLVGCVNVAMAGADLYMLANGTQAGTPAFLDHLAPTPAEAWLQLAYGLALAVLPFLMRFLLRRAGGRI